VSLIVYWWLAKMNVKSGFGAKFKAMWRNHRWHIFAALAALSFLFELYEFFSRPSKLQDPLHFIEITAYGVILPIVFVTLHRIEAKKNNAIDTLALRDLFVYQLNNAGNWNELTEAIALFPRNIIPLLGVRLLIYQPNTNNFEIEFTRGFNAGTQAAAPDHSTEMEVAKCHLADAQEFKGVKVCNCPLQLQSYGNNVIFRRYCLPLPNANSLIGLLQLDLPISYNLTPGRIDLLNSLAPEISMSLSKGLLQRKTLLQEAAIETERLRLASDLHDTLGQDLAFLRHKIDQIVQDGTLLGMPHLLQEFHQMRTVAEEANQTVRNILIVTRPDQDTVLDARLLAYARAVSKRANFVLSLKSNGQFRILSRHMQFQAFLIFREILANIERHANARNVVIVLTWAEEGFTMSISDDGRGFQSELIDENTHFGLTIIEARVVEMNGRMIVESAPNVGTTISIWLPINHKYASASIESRIYEENPPG
jgi:signal transduction histidine kinase